jgi:asparaginyl-tRNA synthetase
VPTLKDSTSYAADFFGRPAYLTVSGQLNAEIYACALSKVYTFGPTFRAENSNTTRHLAEFWMIEPEIAFCDRDGCMDIAEGYVRHLIDYALKVCAHDVQYLDAGSAVWEGKAGLIDSLKRVSASTFARCSYTEAIDILTAAAKGGHAFDLPVTWGMDLPTQMERYLAETHFKGPVFVYNYPKEIKSFYMRLNDDGKTVAAFDLLVPGIGELVGGSQREERADVLERRIKECGLDPVAYSWYLDLRRFGTVKHAGFGLGFERAIMLVTGVDNIRDTIGFPRTPQNCNY